MIKNNNPKSKNGDINYVPIMYNNPYGLKYNNNNILYDSRTISL